MKITPIGKRIVIRKCVNDHVRDKGSGNVLIYKPDNTYEQTNTVEIIDVADDCRMFRKEHIGDFIQVPEFINGLNELDYDKGLFFIKEDVVEECLEMGVLMIPEEVDNG